MKKFSHLDIESASRAYWREHNTYQNLKKQLSYNKPFSFLDGPPYTSGKVHLGTAWNKSLKDMVLRLKRMQGYNAFDRAGYDMHGLPTEHATMKKLGLHTNEDIEKYGVDKFIAACREWCITNMKEMNIMFEHLGIWMDFENAYQTISPDYVEGIWMMIKRAHENGRLYPGFRSMAWDPVFETACAKHELVYETVTDTSIYVKLPILKDNKKTNEYLIVWTTTPWTIPFNLAVMVNPTVEYVRANVDGEIWVVANDLAEQAIVQIAKKEFIIIEQFPGSALEGTSYEHPFADLIPYAAMKKEHPAIHTVVLSADYVDTEAGTGLVHCAPGCGPEDYEVGVKNNLPAYNTVQADGSFPPPFAGLKARKDDKAFIDLLDKKQAIAAVHKYKHEYPHSERSKAPVIYKTTKQWFFKVSDLKPAMLQANSEIAWQPQAAYNAFQSWLENLRDNSITKQRYWGTPVPIWANDETGEVLVIGSLKELETLSGVHVADPHKPHIDAVTIPSKKHPGTTLKRIPDILDVWVDAGSASWNSLYYPSRTDLFEQGFPADFILEGKDQIRGWFNLLMVAGFLAFNKPSFKSVYMHGYINDSEGRKMSKSLGNYITPEEVLPTYGVDAFRMYVIGATAPGLDLNYNKEDLATVYKNLNVLWNTAQYLIDLCATNDLIPLTVSDLNELNEEELYMLSRMESATLEANEVVEEYDLPKLPRIITELTLELSRTYIQLIREKAAGDEKQLVADTLYTVLRRILVLLAPISPFVSEILWQDLNKLTGEQGSVHQQSWPCARKEFIDKQMEEDFSMLQQIITAGLAAREQVKQGVRWPMQELVVTLPPKHAYDNLIKRQVNVKHVRWGTVSTHKTMLPNFGALGKSFGKETQKVAKLIEEVQPIPPVVIEGYSIMPEHVVIKESAPEGYVSVSFSGGNVYLQSEITAELVEEGYVRELSRRVQALRKDMGLQKKDAIQLHISGAHTISHNHLQELSRKCNATLVSSHFKEHRDEHIRERTYTISAQKTI